VKKRHSEFCDSHSNAEMAAVALTLPLVPREEVPSIDWRYLYRIPVIVSLFEQHSLNLYLGRSRKNPSSFRVRRTRNKIKTQRSYQT